MKQISHFRLCKVFPFIFVVIALCVLSSVTQAANIYAKISGSGEFRAAVIDGIIEEGDFDRFEKVLRDNQGQISTLYLFSPGGDFDEAIKIGRSVRELELHSQVPMQTASGRATCKKEFNFDISPLPKTDASCMCVGACFFIHIGGVSRGGTFLAVHRPVFEKGKLGELSEAAATHEFDSLQQRARDYMAEMGVPNSIQEDILSTPPDHPLLLDEKTVKKYFWESLPSRHDWIEDKCPGLSAKEQTRWFVYVEKNVRAIETNIKPLSSVEEADYKELSEKSRKSSECATPIYEQKRLEAFEKHFGVKPSDYTNQDFTKWSMASLYLGKSFDDILAEEKFEEENTRLKIARFNSLSRTATASAPYVYLSDTDGKPRVVNAVTLLSPPKPSERFQNTLIESLTAAWGKPVMSEKGEWSWHSSKFQAILSKQTYGTGPTIKLEMATSKKSE